MLLLGLINSEERRLETQCQLRKSAAVAKLATFKQAGIMPPRRQNPKYVKGHRKSSYVPKQPRRKLNGLPDMRFKANR